MRTFIRRPGNKSKHLKYIMPLVPEFSGTYIEPFLGTGAVFLKLTPNKWILNDINEELMGIWSLVRDNPEFLLNEISKLRDDLLSLDTQEKIKYCKGITEGIEDEEDKQLRSIKCHMMTYCSFESTLSHSYSSSQYFFTGLYKPLFESNHCHVFTDGYRDKIRQLHLVLGKGLLLNQDYCEALKHAKEGDFVFLDPPYVGDKGYTFSYNEDDSIDGSFVRKLIDELNTLDKKNVKWMMTQVDSEFIRDNFGKYTIVEIKTNNGICDKLKKCELLIMNY